VVVLRVIKTVAILIALWAVFLFTIPIGISMAESQLGIQRMPPQIQIATIVFVVSTIAATWAALMLTVKGVRTPLVRRSLVIATLGQGAAIGLAFGSVPVLLYVLVMVSVGYFFGRRHLKSSA
jgi:hypothetical protein